jgi:sodium-dependent dicarboxylate transporter 2/3/5
MNQRVQIIAGIAAGLIGVMILRMFTAVPVSAQFMAGIAILMAWWWLTECVPLAVTSLLPLILIPVCGISSAPDIASEYMDSIIFLFIGGFILAFAMEKWNLHKRIAYYILTRTGTKPHNILAGIMATAYFISMWISNTSTVMMLIAAVLALIREMYIHIGDHDQQKKFAKAILIGLAYSASIGGMATLVGTPTNMIFYREYMKAFPDSTDMNFFEWAKLGVPVSILLIITCYFVIRFLFLRNCEITVTDKKWFRHKLADLGRMKREEKTVWMIFIFTVLLWFTRTDISFGQFTWKGWNHLFGSYSTYIDDSTVAISAAVLLFIIPASTSKSRIMEWKDAEKLPLDIILLFGGGFALAEGFRVSGLSAWIGNSLHAADSVNPLFIVLMITILITIISEFASNVASIQLMMPVILSVVVHLHVPPLVYLVPAALSASLGFMLPVATPPNTIVYGTKMVSSRDLARAGLLINMAGILIITLLAMILLQTGYYST